MKLHDPQLGHHSEPANADQDASLAGLLQRVASRASEKQLVVAGIAGVLGLSAALLFAPSARPAGLPFASLALFSLWAILAREAEGRLGAHRWLQIAQALCAFLGAAALFVFGLWLLTFALGIWIS